MSELIPNLKHLSGSTINTFIERKYGFYKSKIIKAPFATGPSMARGKAVENCVNKWADGYDYPSIEHLYIIAQAEYEKEVADYKRWYSSPSEADIEKEKKISDSVPALAKLAVETYMDLFDMGRPSTQTPIRTQYEGINFDIIGFLDFYQYNRMVRDCKVLGQTKNQLPQAYCITGALYKKATNVRVYYDLFIANKEPKHVQIELSEEDYKFGLSYGAAAAKCILELQECKDPVRFFELTCFPNLDEIYDRAERMEACERWGIYLPEDR